MILSGSSSKVLCLVLTGQTIQAGLVELGGKPQILVTTKPYLLTDQEEQFSLVVDTCLQELGEVSESVDQAVFCLDESWADSHDVLAQKKTSIEAMLKELNIEALGFISLKAGMAEALVAKQPAPEFITIMLTKQDLEIEYFSAGKSQGRVVSVRTNSISDDLNQLVQKATPLLPTETPVPYQVSLVNQDETELVVRELSNYCLNYQWPGIDQPPIVSELPYKDLLDQIMIYAVSVWLEKPAVATDEQTNSSSLATQTFPTFTKRAFQKTRISQTRFIPQIVLGIVLGLLTLGGLGWWYLNQNSQVFLSVKLLTKPIVKRIVASLTTANLDKNQYVLASQAEEQEVELSASKTTTGTATIGQKAKGKVQLFNKLGQAKTLTQGTQLHTSSGLDFILDEEVVVPAASVTLNQAPAGETVNYGVLETSVTASIIGDTGNLPAGTEMTVGVFDRSSYLAKAAALFTGGTSEQVAVVSQEDVDSLSRDLKKQALTEAAKIWQDSSKQGVYTTPVQSSAVILVEADPAVGQQASQVTVKLKTKVTALSYNIEAIHQLSNQVLQDAVPDGFKLSQNEPQVLTKYLENSKSPAVELELTTVAVASIYQEDLKKQILGQNIKEIINILESKPEIDTIDLRFEPKLSKWILRQLPQNPTQINLTIQNE